MREPGDWMKALEQTYVVRYPKQSLATFGVTRINYYVVTSPVYADLAPGDREGVVRKGRVIAERPAIVTPYYALNVKGFSDDAYDYLQFLADRLGANSPGILYQYRNESDNLEIIGGEPAEIAHRISDDLDGRSENLAVVMVGVDELWDVALLKFMYEFTASSATLNVDEMMGRGLLDPNPAVGGLPTAAVQRIESMFRDVDRGRSPDELKHELDQWGAFEYYEDRFLNIFRNPGR
ncbi:MAG: hypothetical protein IIB17_05620 [Chloroflexi bacterium]|nr:hypothetical protein [Chloroflexota bacterium]